MMETNRFHRQEELLKLLEDINRCNGTLKELHIELDKICKKKGFAIFV